MERNRGVAVLAAGLIGFNICNFLHLVFDDSDSEIEKVQAYNQQIELDLDRQFESVEDLILTIDSQEFRFVIGDVSCEGKYEVTNEIATIAGGITCSETIQTES